MVSGCAGARRASGDAPRMEPNATEHQVARSARSATSDERRAMGTAARATAQGTAGREDNRNAPVDVEARNKAAQERSLLASCQVEPRIKRVSQRTALGYPAIRAQWPMGQQSGGGAGARCEVSRAQRRERLLGRRGRKANKRGGGGTGTGEQARGHTGSTRPLEMSTHEGALCGSALLEQTWDPRPSAHACFWGPSQTQRCDPRSAGD